MSGTWYNTHTTYSRHCSVYSLTDCDDTNINFKSVQLPSPLPPPQQEDLCYSLTLTFRAIFSPLSCLFSLAIFFWSSSCSQIAFVLDSKALASGLPSAFSQRHYHHKHTQQTHGSSFDSILSLSTHTGFLGHFTTPSRTEAL